MRLRALFPFVFLVAAFAGPYNAAEACTGLFVKAEDGAMVYARSLEFGEPLDSKLVVIPRGTAYQGTMPNGAEGEKWITRYGILGMNFRGLPYIVDGFNEKGLQFGNFWFPGFAEYAAYDPAQAPKSIAAWEFGVWLLGRFATVKEAREGLKDLRMVEVVNKELGMVVPAHFLLLDAGGEAIVIEPVGGKLVVHENPAGVMTNAPTFDWHLTNLRNYLNLSPTQARPATLGGVKLAPLGEGAGMLGLPGDVTPPSRFVRAAFYTNALPSMKTGPEALAALMRLHQTFYIAKGMVQPAKGDDGPEEITQWETYSDLKALRLYFSTYDNMNMRMVDASKLDFSPGPIRAMAIDQPQEFQDLTSGLR